ncbi:MAG: bifunctional tetrahydrofolate synthase/dihydrofolate synthase [Proteobacteria bacterium]|nr:bifunctional tetrahydrofolate synthase/dihydrofolate synthase [Pseudomonadota bacterium]
MPSPGLPLNDWLVRLETLSPWEIDLGLERVQCVLERLNLEQAETVFHVAGTNGKGSSVVMLESLLRTTGVRVGSYTSPHIIRYNERIRIDGVEATDAAIVAAFERIEAVRDDVPLTYFEFGTLAALAVFADAGVHTVILEIGMGGRLDAVNAVEPDAGLITNVSLDHCEWLGDDVETIALEKAGIMRPGKPLVFASSDLPRAIVARAEAIGSNLIVAGRDYHWALHDDVWSWQGAQTHLKSLRRPSLPGDIQVENAAGVLALVEAVGHSNLLRTDLINAAFSDLHLRGRMQLLDADGSWLLDVAHNPAAAGVLADTLRTLPIAGRTIAIIGILDDKDVEGVVSPLVDAVANWVAVTADNPRAIPAADLARRIANVTNQGCLIATSIRQARDHARALAGSDDRVLVTGSFYLVGPLLELLLPVDIYSPR